MHFVRQLLYYNGILTNYYKSYYLARAGLETSLTQIKNRGVGFAYEIKPKDAIITENFLCGKDCSVHTKIIGKSAFINRETWNGT